MGEVEIAYPKSRWWGDERGMWLLVESTVVAGLDHYATFLVALPFEAGLGQRSWAYWSSGGKHNWMGTRHTNFPDGSVCAFAPTEGVWSEGGSIVTLIDLYTVWALRQLHLHNVGRWPGAQHANSRYYRLLEFKDDELCSCQFGLHYKDCCKPNDLAAFLASPKAFKSEFDRVTNGCGLNHRCPPKSVATFFASDLDTPPSLMEAFGM